MKNFLLFVFLLTSVTAYCQPDIKLNPLGLLFGDYTVAAEFAVSDEFGVEPFVGLFTANNDLGTAEYKLTSFRAGAMGKYYLSPQKGTDRFHIGAYTRFSTGNWKAEDSSGTEEFANTRFSLGILLGQKWVTDKNFIAEINFGAGRAFVNDVDGEDVSSLALADIDILLRLVVGLRLQ